MAGDNNSSKWFDIDVVPNNYTLSPEHRPGKFDLSDNTQTKFHVIDFSKVDSSFEEKENVIKQIMKSSQDVGGFQVINHGFCEELIRDTYSVLKEFFSLPLEEKVYEGMDNGWMYQCSTDVVVDEDVHLWRESLKHPSHPLEDAKKRWTNKPFRYREVVGAYILAMERLSSRLLELMSLGLGLEVTYLKDLSEVQLFNVNNYPPCPNPSLTLGLYPQKDASLITILYQGDISGLQMLQDGEWFNVEVIQNAFVVNIGSLLEIISNGKLNSPIHRAVTNVDKTRTSISVFVNPSPKCIVKPATALINIDESNSTLLEEATTYENFVKNTKAYGPFTGFWLSYWGTNIVDEDNP